RPDSMIAAESSARLWDSLIRDYPKEPEYLSAQRDTLGFLHFLARATRQHQRELEFAQKVNDVREKLAAMKPTAPPHREDIANGIMNQAQALRKQKNPAEAEEQYRRALAVWEKLADEYPMNALYRARILSSCAHLAGLLRSIGKPSEAERFRVRF